MYLCNISNMFVFELVIILIIIIIIIIIVFLGRIFVEG